jgi:hypothetical protein
VKVLDDLPLSEVVDILLSLSELDLLLTVERRGDEGKNSFATLWTSEDLATENEEKLRSLLLGARHFFEHLSEKEPDRLKEPHMQNAIRALMNFIHEALDKVQKYTPLFKRDEGLSSLADLQEVKDLEEYYASAIAPHMKEEEGEFWEDRWDVKGLELTDVQRRGLTTLSDLCSDKFYDLLYLLKEDGKPFYDFDMLKKAHMLYELDTSISTQEIEGLFHKVRMIEDRQGHLRAQYLLKSCWVLIDDFFKEALKYKESECVSSLTSAVMALMIAANPRNLMQTSSSEKTAYHYVLNCMSYMRQALSSEEYQKLIMISHERRPFQATLYLLIHKLVFSIFTQQLEHKEMIALIRRMMSEAVSSNKRPLEIPLIEQDAALRSYLSRYPAGALHKLDALLARGEGARGYDPLMQNHLPEGLFTFELGEKPVHCLKIPSFWRQEFIQKAEIVKEFDALMRSFTMGEKEDKLLYVGLQDRTSWQDFARCSALEEVCKKEQYYRRIYLFCLAKHTDFYHQSSEFSDMSCASSFIETFYEQVMGGAQSGFYLSESLSPHVKKWLKPILSFVHSAIFKEKLILTKEERLDFIDIAYLYLVAMSLEVTGASFITFGDKDGVDASAAQTSLWYALNALQGGRAMSDEERGMFLYLLYSPALLLRERAVDERMFQRVASAIERIEKAMIQNKDTFKKEGPKLSFTQMKLV